MKHQTVRKRKRIVIEIGKNSKQVEIISKREGETSRDNNEEI